MTSIHIILKFSKYFQTYSHNLSSHSSNHNFFANVKNEGLSREVICPRSDISDLVKFLTKDISIIHKRVRTHN